LERLIHFIGSQKAKKDLHAFWSICKSFLAFALFFALYAM
jgi:hypothetical protein